MKFVKWHTLWVSSLWILGLSILLLGFAMGQQSLSDNCNRFGMFHYAGKIYSCQQVKPNDVVVTSFKKAGKA